MGKTDRIIRIFLAVAFAYLYFSEAVSGTLGIILLILVVVLVLTSIIGFCTLYPLFRLSTFKK
ncbi:MAG: DUF2892 domain-containing protein [Bacteroidota bacterium]|nr:DUF2892 domain-containing protein [Bacteroidota bacterium]